MSGVANVLELAPMSSGDRHIDMCDEEPLHIHCAAAISTDNINKQMRYHQEEQMLHIVSNWPD